MAEAGTGGAIGRAAAPLAALLRSRGSIARRMIVAAFAWSAIVLLAAGWSLQALYRTETQRRLDEDLDATVQTLTAAVDSDPGGMVDIDGAKLPNDPRFARVFSGWYWAIIELDAAGKPAKTYPSRSFWDSAAKPASDTLATSLRTPGVMAHGAGRGPRSEPLRESVRVVKLPERPNPVAIYVAIDRTSADAATRRFALELAASLGVLALGLAAGALVLVRFGLAPLRVIRGNLADIRAGRREALDGEYAEELTPLVQEINTLIGHNRKVVERARTQVGNLAHALKTPLAVLMNEAKGDDRLAELVRRQTEAMTSNVNHYLKRAQAAAQAGVLGARAEVTPAVEDIARMLERLHRSKGVAIDVDGDPAAIFRGERGDLDELVGNLLENAAKWCKSRVRARIVRRGDTVEVCVDDDGPGLPAGDRAKAIERGRRLDERAPGTGLGLSIVHDLAEIYGGAFHLEDSPMGGLRARLELPAAPL